MGTEALVAGYKTAERCT